MPAPTRSDVLVVANPRAGNGRAPHLLHEVCRVLAAHRPVAICGQSREETAATLAAALPRARAVVAIGGDGLIHLLAQQVAGTGVPLGIIPAGSGNDIAHSLRLPRSFSPALEAVRAALDAADPGTAIDVLEVSGAGFRLRVVAVVSLGLDARVNHRAVAEFARFGRWRYLAALAAELRALTAVTYRIEDDTGVQEVTGLLAAVANLRYIGSGMKIAPQARPTDALADLITVGDIPLRTLLRVFPRIYRGTHISHRAVAHRRIGPVTISGNSDVVVHGDGEPLGRMPVRIEIRPGALRVLGVKENNGQA